MRHEKAEKLREYKKGGPIALSEFERANKWKSFSLIYNEILSLDNYV